MYNKDWHDDCNYKADVDSDASNNCHSLRLWGAIVKMTFSQRIIDVIAEVTEETDAWWKYTKSSKDQPRQPAPPCLVFRVGLAFYTE